MSKKFATLPIPEQACQLESMAEYIRNAQAAVTAAYSKAVESETTDKPLLLPHERSNLFDAQAILSRLINNDKILLALTEEYRGAWLGEND